MQHKLVEEHTTDADGNPTGGTTSGLGLSIMWQNGALGRGDERQEPNGAFVEGVLQAALGRLEFYQQSKFACEDNANAILAIKAALGVLERRSRLREKRGVAGTHEP